MFLFWIFEKCPLKKFLSFSPFVNKNVPESLCATRSQEVNKNKINEK